MSSSINLSLTDELRAFIDHNTGDGSLYATPSEFLRSLLREKKERQEAAELRYAILEWLSGCYRRTGNPILGRSAKRYAAVQLPLPQVTDGYS